MGAAPETPGREALPRLRVRSACHSGPTAPKAGVSPSGPPHETPPLHPFVRAVAAAVHRCVRAVGAKLLVGGPGGGSQRLLLRRLRLKAGIRVGPPPGRPAGQ